MECLCANNALARGAALFGSARSVRATAGSLARRRRRDAPDGIAHIVGQQDGTALVERHPDRAAVRLAVRVQEAAQHVLRRTAGAARAKRHEDQLVTAGLLAV